MNPAVINMVIQESGTDKSLISDGYHTFGELYDHRVTLFMALCRMIHLYHPDSTYPDSDYPVWRSKLHSDGTMFDDFFIMGIGLTPGKMITYHLPISRWELTNFAQTLYHAPEWDGHTSDDVLLRLTELIQQK